jgi:hypothetical protein
MGVAPVNEEVWTAVIVAGIILEENRIPGLFTAFFIYAKKYVCRKSVTTVL